MISREDVGKAIVNAGLTWSDGIMREKNVNVVVDAVMKVVAPEVAEDVMRGYPTRRYYLTRAEVARMEGDTDRMEKYSKLAGALPLGEQP